MKDGVLFLHLSTPPPAKTRARMWLLEFFAVLVFLNVSIYIVGLLDLQGRSVDGLASLMNKLSSYKKGAKQLLNGVDLQ